MQGTCLGVLNHGFFQGILHSYLYNFSYEQYHFAADHTHLAGFLEFWDIITPLLDRIVHLSLTRHLILACLHDCRGWRGQVLGRGVCPTWQFWVRSRVHMKLNVPPSVPYWTVILLTISINGNQIRNSFYYIRFRDELQKWSQQSLIVGLLLPAYPKQSVSMVVATVQSCKIKCYNALSFVLKSPLI